MSKLQRSAEMGSVHTTYFDNSARSQLADWASSGVTGTSSPVREAKLRALQGLYATLVATPETSKLSSMDLWGNLKIPFLNMTNGNDWTNLSHNLNSDDYSSLAGIPFGDINYDSKTTFTLESSYIQLQCSNVTTSSRSGPDGSMGDMVKGDMLSHAFGNFTSLTQPGQFYQLPNGTWHGISWSGSRSTWSIGLDRFVNPLWFGGNKTNYTEFQKSSDGPRSQDLYRPTLFKDEIGIEAGPTRLLFQAMCKDSFFAPQLFYTGYCDVTQRYVESQVTCERSTAARRNCSVTAQRPSQHPHASEQITALSFPFIFYYFSSQLPSVVGGGVSFQTETSLYYLKDPSLRSFSGDDRDFLENVTAKDLGVRLGQLLNTYFQISQLSQNITAGSGVDSTFRPRISVLATTSSDVVLFDVLDVWALLCVISCAVLLAAGVVSVVLAHWARSPEILGYVSTVFRDSRHMELETGLDRLTAVELSKTMMDEKIRYGLVGKKHGDEFRMGVARQEETTSLSDNSRRV
ncbi:hypothetical protein CGCSCA5_v007497 [Colletotrichum siamense]|nr:hypothetical protein CGCSCA5_v007497 [Colletotrichum siamense]